MMLKNTENRYGMVAITFHWLVVVAVFGLFSLGWWMTGLDYYDARYKLGPWWHKSIGIMLFITMVFRLVWRLYSAPPKPLASHQQWQVTLAHAVHWLLYLLIMMIVLSGYLISTADNRAIEVFGWFSIPATLTDIPNQEDIAGKIHWILACVLMGLVALHAIAALKHHFIDKDRSLQRMLGR